ncbi:MAG: response regulator [Pseudomonadota bacterium]|nr:response regulator [Pseudomonadota bacterium]
MTTDSSTHSHHLLLVDDDPTSLALLSAYFEDTPYKITTASDGVKAQEIISSLPANDFSAYLFDYHMPHKDGITLLNELKSDSRYAMIPVILQTSADSHEDINRGIQAGAFYYLLKPFSKSHLLSIVEAAVKGFTNHQQATNKAYSQNQAAQLLKTAHFTFKTIEQAKHLSNILAYLTPNPQKVGIGLFELMINAVEHGNLAIGYSEKTRLIHNDQLQQEIEQRLSLSENKNKQVDVLIERKDGLLTVTISDMGNGFDSRPYLDFSIDRAMDNHGRGIMMAKNLSFDDLQYSEKGNSVVCTVKMPE